MKHIIIATLLFVMMISCKNNAQVNSPLVNTNEQLVDLPNELANKTWIYISKDLDESYDKILEYSKEQNSNNIITSKKKLSLKIDEQNSFVNYDIESVIKTNNGYLIKTKENGIDINFSWIDKKISVGKWTLYIADYNGPNRDFKAERIAVNKDYVTPKNFPEQEVKKTSNVILEEDKIISDIYSEPIDDFPLEGQFSCDYTEDGDDYVFKGGILRLSNKDYNVENVTEGTVKKYKNNIVIQLEEYLNIQCDVRKIKSKENTFALFYNSFTNTKFDVDQAPFYSKTKPIAEIEIVNNNTIKKKWLGVYNKRTKQVENVDDMDWQDEYCTTIKRVD